jgi:hypothetical protein
MRRLAIAALAAWTTLGAAPASAAGCKMTSTDREVLTATINDFSTALRLGDYQRIQRVIPRRIIRKMAADAGASPRAVIDGLAKVMARGMQKIEVVAFDMQTENLRCTMAGSALKYVQVPTEMIVDIEGAGRHSMSSHTLALLEGGMWYLLRVSEPQELLVLTDLYPELAAIEFPPAKMTRLQ